MLLNTLYWNTSRGLLSAYGSFFPDPAVKQLPLPDLQPGKYILPSPLWEGFLALGAGLAPRVEAVSLPNLLSHSSPSRVGVVRKTILLYFETTREVIFLIFAVSLIQMNPKPTL